MLAIMLCACDDSEPQQDMYPGGVDLFTANGTYVKANGQTVTMPAADTEMIIEIGSRGVTPEGLVILNPDRTMSVSLVDAYDPAKLEVYDRIKCQEGDKIWYDDLYKQRIKVTASPLTGDPGKYTDREINLKIIPVGGYKVYSIIRILHPKP